MKVKLFTHTDLDGVGCAIVGKQVFDDIDITYCDYHNVNKLIGDFYENRIYQEYDMVYITDISVDEEIANKIDVLKEKHGIKLLDHHPTADWLNKYEWASVNTHHISLEIDKNDFVLSSGTSMLYLELVTKGYYKDKIMLDTFVENVRRYDTWEWKNKYNDYLPKKLNDLLYIYGREKFYEVFSSNPSKKPFGFELSKEDYFVLELEQKRIDNYIKSKQKTIIEKDILGFKGGIVFAEQYHSELGNILSENNSHLDFIAIINPSTNKVSYRNTKESVNLSEIAQYDEFITKEYIDNIFK